MAAVARTKCGECFQNTAAVSPVGTPASAVPIADLWLVADPTRMCDSFSRDGHDASARLAAEDSRN